MSRLLTILVLSGMIVSLYSVYYHYQEEGSSFCNFSENLNCDVVNKSIYSEILGIPIALFGFLMYVALAILYYQNMWKEGFLIIFSAGIFTIFLTYIEIFLLKALCPLCVANAIIVYSILWINWKKTNIKEIREWLVKPI